MDRRALVVRLQTRSLATARMMPMHEMLFSRDRAGRLIHQPVTGKAWQWTGLSKGAPVDAEMAEYLNVIATGEYLPQNYATKLGKLCSGGSPKAGLFGHDCVRPRADAQRPTLP
jgi:hypothetical protein